MISKCRHYNAESRGRKGWVKGQEGLEARPGHVVTCRVLSRPIAHLGGQLNSDALISGEAMFISHFSLKIK